MSEGLRDDVATSEDDLFDTLMLTTYLTGSRLDFYLYSGVGDPLMRVSDDAFLRAFKRLPLSTQRMIAPVMIHCHFAPQFAKDYTSRPDRLIDSRDHPKSWRYIFSKFHTREIMTEFYGDARKAREANKALDATSQ